MEPSPFLGRCHSPLHTSFFGGVLKSDVYLLHYVQVSGTWRRANVAHCLRPSSRALESGRSTSPAYSSCLGSLTFGALPQSSVVLSLSLWIWRFFEWRRRLKRHRLLLFVVDVSIKNVLCVRFVVMCVG